VAAVALALQRCASAAEGQANLVCFDAAVHDCLMGSRHWGDLDPRLRQGILLGGAFEAGLKLAALIDLARRPSQDIRGSKAAWATAVVLLNSGGVVPIVYLLRGRRTQ
jgi:hypothetical protein